MLKLFFAVFQYVYTIRQKIVNVNMSFRIFDFLMCHCNKIQKQGNTATSFKTIPF